MSLTDDQIKQLLEWFVKSSQTNQEWGDKRKRAEKENHQWIQPSIIQNMSDEELEKRFLEYYNSDTGYRAVLNKIYRDRIIREKDNFKRTLSYLFDESINIISRVDNVLHGEYQIKGFGRSIMSSFLMDFKPESYCLWNNKVEDGLKVLGWKFRDRGDSIGLTYQKVLNEAKKLIKLKPDLNLSLNDIDLFFHTIAATKEGKEKIISVTGGPPPDNIKYWQIGPGEQARLWDELRSQSIAAVGWDEFNFDLEGKSKAELSELYKKHIPDHSDRQVQIGTTMLWNFLNLQPGDKFITNKGRSFLLGLGTVIGSYKFRPEREEYKHTVDVDYYAVSETGIPIPEKLKGKFGKTITPLTRDEFQIMEELFNGKNFWIFQANPEYYDLEGALKNCEEINWGISQQRDKIKKGDEVFLWLSGTNAGIYAVAELLTDPGELDEEPCDKPFIKKPEQFEKARPEVRLSKIQVLERPVTRAMILAIPALNDLTIIKVPQGTNFSLTSQEADLIKRLINDGLGDYLPNKDDFESAYRMICSSGDKIAIDSVLDQIEMNAINSGHNLNRNWRLITAKNIEIW